MSDKRRRHPRSCDYAKGFTKDWDRLLRAGRHDLAKLKQAILLLVANDGPLGPEWRDHPLKGPWAGTRECHIGGDFLLIYALDEDIGPAGSVNFLRIGTHSELFRE